MTHPLYTSPIYDALRQSIYDRLAGRARLTSAVLREAKQGIKEYEEALRALAGTQDAHTNGPQEVER